MIMNNTREGMACWFKRTGDMDEMVLGIISNKLNIEISQISINRGHSLGKRKGPGLKPRAIIVKFAWYKEKSLEIKNYGRFFGFDGFSVTDSLTPKRMEHLKKGQMSGH